ncbi:hypothetical protein RUM43_001977 [Polyplax serrata]|uniref:Uncharacterized protein n=1 Tax=Polyplax serrata TaxID=468196 RepID=A0AAN8P1Q1_POLSC
MLNLRNSPLARTPPKNFDTFPDTMVNGSPTGKTNRLNVVQQSPGKMEPSSDQSEKRTQRDSSERDDNQEQFEMDM